MFSVELTERTTSKKNFHFSTPEKILFQEVLKKIKKQKIKLWLIYNKNIINVWNEKNEG